MSAPDIAGYWPFTELPEAAGAAVSEAALSFTLAPDKWLVRQGEVADALFVLVEGELDMYQGNPPRWRNLLLLGNLFALVLVAAVSALFVVFYVPSRLLFLAEDYKYPATWIRLWLVAMLPLLTIVFIK